jgi:hypothetical protein
VKGGFLFRTLVGLFRKNSTMALKKRRVRLKVFAISLFGKMPVLTNFHAWMDIILTQLLTQTGGQLSMFTVVEVLGRHRP